MIVKIHRSGGSFKSAAEYCLGDKAPERKEGEERERKQYGVRVAMERKPCVFGDHAVSVRDSSSGVDASHALPGRARR